MQSMSAIIIGTLIRQLYTISFDCIYTGTSLFKIMICRCVGKIDIIQVCRKQVAVKNGGKNRPHCCPNYNDTNPIYHIHRQQAQDLKQTQDKN